MTSPVLANFGASQLLIIAALALFLFGGKKIPELMKGLGTGLKEFKKATQSEDVEDKKIEKKDSDNSDENKKDLTVSK